MKEKETIPIEWLRKQIVELMYYDEIKAEIVKVFWMLIARWEKENELQ